MYYEKEKRKHARLELHVPLSYRTLGAKGVRASKVLTKDISEGGVRFLTDRFVSLASRLVVEIILPASNFPVKSIIKVSWIKKVLESENFEIGAQFLDMSKEDHEAMCVCTSKTMNLDILHSLA